MSKFNIFIPIRKVDEEKRLVYGIATAEMPDSSGEICDYATTVPYYKAWSARIEKASDGKSKGNLRSMHANIAAGKVTQVEFNDAEKQIEICAKVIDNDEWKKVIEGVYTGFSQGGAYVKKWTDGDYKKYTANPSEISLVDNPCLPTATFEVMKTGGGTEMRKFKTQEIDKMAKIDNTQEDLVQGWKAKDGSFHISKAAAVAHNEELAKKKDTAPANGEYGTSPDGDGETGDNEDESDTEGKDHANTEKDGNAKAATNEFGKRDFSTDERQKAADAGEALPDGSFPIKTKQDLKNAIHAYGRAKDPAKAKAHIIERAKALGSSGDLPQGWDGSDKGAEAKKSAISELKKYGGDEVWDAKCALEALCTIMCLLNHEEYEAKFEGENEPEQLSDLKMVIDKLKSFIASEIMEEEVDGEDMEMSIDDMAQSAKDILGKVGAKMSVTSKGHVQKMYESAQDHLGKMQECMKALGMDGMDGGDGKDGDADTKKAAIDELAKVKAELTKKFEEAFTPALEKATATIDALNKRIGDLEAQPAGAKGVTKVVLKDDSHGGESGNSSPVEAIMKRTDLSPEMMFKELSKHMGQAK